MFQLLALGLAACVAFVPASAPIMGTVMLFGGFVVVFSGSTLFLTFGFRQRFFRGVFLMTDRLVFPGGLFFRVPIFF